MASIFTEPLRRLVRSEPSLGLGTRQAQVIAVCASKGGVGKTTTSVNLAAGLAMRHGQKVLLVDFDAQGHCSLALRQELRGVCYDSVTDVLLGKRRDMHEIAIATRVPGLWLTPADKDLTTTEGVMSGRIGKEFLLRRCLKTARSHYDTIIIDCPPNVGTLTVNALVAADWCLVPCDMSVLALEGVDDIFGTLETISDNLGRDIGVLGVLRTRYDARNQKVNEAVQEALESRYPAQLLGTTIPINTRLAQAQLEGKPIFSYDAACRGAAAYGDLMTELAPRMGF